MSQPPGLVDAPLPVQDEPVEEPGTVPPTTRRRRWKKPVLITLLAIVVLVAGGLVAAGLYVHSVDSNVKRVDAFGDIPLTSRPAKVAADAENMLILGSDSRDPNNLNGTRSDTIILAHLTKGRGSAQLISIPRDTWTHVPASKDGRQGNVDAKINAAFAWGGIPLVVQTIESFTGVRIDHVAVIDFAGFKDIIDAIGGVDIFVDHGFTSHHSLSPTGVRQFPQGWQHMDGATALDYSRERYSFADGDFERIKHQQQMIKAVLEKAAKGGLLSDPVALNAFVRAGAHAVSVDQTMSLLDTVMELRNLRGGDLSFFTSPSRGTGMVGSQSVVFSDTAKAKALFDAVRRDDVPAIKAAATAT